jgi:hypothetical protein
MMNLKGFGRKQSWPNFEVLSQHPSGGTKENRRNLGQDSRSPDRDLNLGPPEYEVWFKAFSGCGNSEVKSMIQSPFVPG